MIVKSYGKILLTGGYLIIDPKNNGIVLNVNAPFRVTILPLSTESHIYIESPQYHQKFTYSIQKVEGNLHISKIEGDINPFIECVIETYFKYCQCKAPANSYKLILEGHKYYYGVESEQKYCEKVDKKVKTGLGSSAGMISSLIIALAYITGIAPEGQYSDWPKPTKKLIGYLAQISNAVAQKKIGSGFDIASALNGNIVFKRKGDIEKSMNTGEIQGEDLDYQKFSLHPSLVVVLINMNSYADTRKMVKAVLDFVAIHSDKTEMFGTKSFKALNDIYNQITEQLQLSVLNAAKCKELTKQMHEILYVVSKETNANILPDPSYMVLKQLMEIPSTVFCTVPGSGGPDAICALGTSLSYLNDVKKVTGKIAIQLKLRNGAKVIKMKTVE